MSKISLILKFLESNNISINEAISLLKKIQQGKKEQEKAVVKGYEKRQGA
jgi:hypothetical protein